MFVERESIGKNTDNYESFGDKMTDGRLTDLSDSRVFRLREAIIESKRLGRPLSEKEMETFVV